MVSGEENEFMHSRQNKMLLVFVAGIAIAGMLACLAPATFGQQSGPHSTRRGTITGTVTADQGKVVAFRVQAHNLNLQL
jgi:hypothetical protein